MAIPSAEFVIAHTRAWVERAVIGLNLCPFAKAPQIKGLVRYVVTEAGDAQALLDRLVDELDLLARTPPETLETTLLIHPGVLADFLDYNDFLDLADAAVEHLQLEGVLQVAGLHPQFQFADTAPEDPGNWTNRAPYPTLHLLREDSVDRAVAAIPDAAAIFGANIATMQALGSAGWEGLRQACIDAAAHPAVPLAGPGAGASSA